MAQSSSSAAAADPAAQPSLTLTRRLNASPEKVYAAWTDPQNLIRWFMPSSFVPGSVKAEIDLRVGGRYRFSFEKDDGEYFEAAGVYREVVPNARLVFTWAWHSTPERESLVTISIKAEGGRTLLTLHHAQFADQAACDAHARGWSGMLDNIEKVLV
jgi:uncharacterized protein YndB with AHSA1/START domain